MAFRLYVGNYPFNFTEEDVQSLFQDFDGVEMEKMCHSKRHQSKSFSFLTCKDIDQLVSVIKKMNNTPVSGRNLIVRASDQSLQEYVNLILENEDGFSSEEQSVSLPVRRKDNYRQPHRQSDSEKSFIHDKIAQGNMQKSSPKSEDSAAVSASKSTYSSGSMLSLDEKKYGVNDCEKSRNISNFSSKTKNSLSNRFGLKTNTDESRKNNAYFSKSELEECEASSCHSYTSSQNFEQTSGKSNTDSHEMTLHEPRMYYQSQDEKNKHQFKTGKNNSSEYSYDNYSDNQVGLKSDNESYKNDAYFSKTPSNSYARESDKSEFETSSNYSAKSSQSSHHTIRHTNMESHKRYQSVNKKNDHYQFKSGMNKFSECSHNNYSDINPQASEDKNAGHFYQQYDDDYDSPVWLSVTNFRFGTHVSTLWELFSDYEPLKIRIVYNDFNRDRALAEAHVCFPNRDIADDVIMNFDNTMFEGRIILVNEIDDLTILNELLSVSHL